MINAVDWAMPSIRPTVSTLKPRLPTRNIGSRLWIISEETSISRLTKPSTQTPAGMRPGVTGGDAGIRALYRPRRARGRAAFQLRSARSAADSSSTGISPTTTIASDGSAASPRRSSRAKL